MTDITFCSFCLLTASAVDASSGVRTRKHGRPVFRAHLKSMEVPDKTGGGPRQIRRLDETLINRIAAGEVAFIEWYYLRVY